MRTVFVRLYKNDGNDIPVGYIFNLFVIKYVSSIHNQHLHHRNRNHYIRD